ncbi:hypothetical protein HDU98_009101 [Podochytrium sp. JEL0797]|nr:hypothetical protein HDU98_009101 [Podochytrium sp. JEL0797]
MFTASKYESGIQLMNPSSNMCVKFQVNGDTEAAGTGFFMWGCDSRDQVFLTFSEADTISFVHASTGMCVTRTSGGTGLEIEPCPSREDTESSPATFSIVQVPTAHACPIGTTISPVFPITSPSSPIVGNPGTKYGNMPYNGDTNYRAIEFNISVTLNGVPQPWCHVSWTPRGNNLIENGWVSSVDVYSDANGHARGYWDAGKATFQFLDVSVLVAGEPLVHTFYGETVLPPGGASGQSIYAVWWTSPWSEWSVDVTPRTFPGTTYYETIGTPHTYGGIQSNTNLIFSVWTYSKGNETIVPVLLRQYPPATCNDFGHEGTGKHCKVNVPLCLNGTYNMVHTAELGSHNGVSGITYAMSYTDKQTGLSFELGAYFLAGVDEMPSGAYGFVEDWYNGAASCLVVPPRVVTYSNVKHRESNSGEWEQVMKASWMDGYRLNHNQMCDNQKYHFKDGVFTLAAGGLNFPGNDDWLHVNGNNIRLANCSVGNPAQIFTTVAGGSSIRNPTSGKCVTVSETRIGAQVSMLPCAQNSSDQVIVSKATVSGGSIFAFEPAGSRVCLGFAESSNILAVLSCSTPSSAATESYSYDAPAATALIHFAPVQTPYFIPAFSTSFIQVPGINLCLSATAVGPCPSREDTESSPATFSIVQVPTAHACPIGTTISPVFPITSPSSPIVGNPGTKYGNMPYNGDTNYRAIEFNISVTLNGVPQPWCHVSWIPRGNNLIENGWVSSVDVYSDANGHARGYWDAGKATFQFLDVSVLVAGEPLVHTFYGEAVIPPGGASGQSIYAVWWTSPWSEWSVDVTPRTFPGTTYYETIGTPHTYGGIQSGTNLIFSVWTYSKGNETIAPVLLRQYPPATCNDFGAEGTGKHCKVNVPLCLNGTYNMVHTAELGSHNGVRGITYAMSYTDKQTGLSFELGAYFLAGVDEMPSGAYGFVEDWYNGAASCLVVPPRVVTYSNVKHRESNSGEWEQVMEASWMDGYRLDHNQMCDNQKYHFKDGVFTLAAGGLNFPGNDDWLHFDTF